MRNVILPIIIFAATAQASIADNSVQYKILATCEQVTNNTDDTGVMSNNVNLNFVVAAEGTNYLKAYVPYDLLAPYIGPKTTMADRENFLQSVLSYLRGYCRLHPFVSFEAAERALSKELMTNHD